MSRNANHDMTNPDAVAALLLEGEEFFEGVWAEVECHARALIDDADFLGTDPREHAAQIMLSMERSVNDDGFLREDPDLARADSAFAAALVYSGRIAA
jgi:hypothetical protein